MDSKCHSSMLEDGSYIGSYHSHSKRYPESEYLSTQRKKEKSAFPLVNSKGSDPGYRKDYVRIKMGFAVEHTEHRNMVKLEHIQETVWRFYAGVHICRQESIWSSGKYVFLFLSNFLKLVKPR